jgi:phage shock protein PspC (stress-responsive transcriptional regulator)
VQVNRLYRCRENRVLAGVASGVAEFFHLDPTLVRILWFVSIFFWGVGILVYIGLAIIVPMEPAPFVAGTPAGSDPEGAVGDATTSTGIAPAAAHPGHTHGAGVVDGHRHPNRGSGRLSMYLGIGLVAIGTLALVDILLPGWWSWRQLWPIVAVGLGGVLIFGALRRERETTDL